MACGPFWQEKKKQFLKKVMNWLLNRAEQALSYMKPEYVTGHDHCEVKFLIVFFAFLKCSYWCTFDLWVYYLSVGFMFTAIIIICCFPREDGAMGFLNCGYVALVNLFSVCFMVLPTICHLLALFHKFSFPSILFTI